MTSALGGRLSLDCSEHLGAMLTATAKRSGAEQAGRAAASRGWMWPLFRSGEARGVAVLVRSQFRNDQRFRMGVLVVLPMTLLYMLMGLQDGALRDPFVPNRHGPPGFSLVPIAVLMFPSMLKLQLAHSEAFHASWIFFACPSDRLKIVRASKDVRALAHVAVHIALLGLVSHLVLQIALFLDPALPFSRPPATKGQNTAAFFGLMMGIGIFGGLFEPVSMLLYRSTVTTVAAFGAVLLASATVDRLTRARVELQTASLEFEG